VAPQRKALLVATYGYQDAGLRGLVAPAHDAEALADVLRDPAIADFDVTVLLNEPTHVVGEAIGSFYGACRRDDLTLLYFSGHGLKDDDGRLYLAMTNTRRDSLLFTGLPATAVSDAMDQCPSRRKVLVLDCCYSGAFPVGRTAKADPAVHTLERFQGKGRAVLTASDATSYSFEGDQVSGDGNRSVFTRYLVEAIRSGAADLDEDGDITLDELYSYVHDRVIADVPQQRPKKQEDVDGRIVLARNVHWELPQHLRFALDSPIAAQRLAAVDTLADLHRRGNDLVRSAVVGAVSRLADDDSRSVAAAAGALLPRLVQDEAVEPPPVPAAPAPATSPPVTSPPTVVSPPPAPPAAPRLPRSAAFAVAAAPEVAAGHRRRRWSSVDGIIGLVVLSLLPLVLVRVLDFESSYPYTAAEFGTPILPWVLAVLLPLAAGAVLLLLRGRWPRGEASGYGLVVGAGLVLTETSLFWTAFFAESSNSYERGPALWSLYAGWVVVVAADVVVLTRSSLAGRPGIVRNWRLACALVAVIAVAVAASTVSEAGDPWAWLANNAELVVLGLAALAVTLLRLRPDQAVAGIIAVTVLGFWLVYFLARDYVEQRVGIPSSTRRTEIVCVLVVVLACGVASLGTLRARRPAMAQEIRR
jgi:hypothetical protein